MPLKKRKSPGGRGGQGWIPRDPPLTTMFPRLACRLMMMNEVNAEPVLSLLNEYQKKTNSSSLLQQRLASEAITSALPRCQDEKAISDLLPDFEGKSVVISLLLKCEGESRVEDLHGYLACLEVLQLLGIPDVTEQLIDACLSVCTSKPFRRYFVSGLLQSAREFFLHYALRIMIGIGEFNETQLASFLPQIHNNQMITCVSQMACYRLEEGQVLSFMRMLQETKGVFVEQCLEEALSNEKWPGVNEVTKACELRKEVLHRVLAKALEFRQWDVIDTCLQRGADIAKACADNGLDLDANTGEKNTNLLEDAFGRQGHLNIAEKLLQAGADPMAKLPDRGYYWSESSVLLDAVGEKNWDRVSFILKNCKDPVGTVSKLLHNGDTPLHILCSEDQADIVDMLFTMGADPLVTDRHGNTLMMAVLEVELKETDARGRYGITSDPGERKESMMRVLIKSGAATHQALVSQSQLKSTDEHVNKTEASFDGETSKVCPLPLWQAVKAGQLRMAAMLYASGACSYGEIHHVATSPSLREAMEKAKRRDILHFLNDISSGPRSLLQTCTLAVSHLIGCGPQRDVRAASLCLPDSLRGRVLQDHVTSPDFLKDYPPDPECRRTKHRNCFYSPRHSPVYYCGHGRMFLPEDYFDYCSCDE